MSGHMGTAGGGRRPPAACLDSPSRLIDPSTLPQRLVIRSLYVALLTFLGIAMPCESAELVVRGSCLRAAKPLAASCTASALAA